MQRKTFPALYKVADPTTGVIEAMVSVFNIVDRSGERVLPGYFAKSIETKLPKGVWMHDWTRPIAKTLEAKELLPGDPLLPDQLKQLGGLYIKGQINLDVQDGKDALSHLKFGTVDEFSFGYSNTKTAYDETTGVRDLVEGEIFEWSPVLVGCNQATALLSAKSLDSNPSELITALLGFDAKQFDAGHLAQLKSFLASFEEPMTNSAEASLDLERRLLAHRTEMVLSR